MTVASIPSPTTAVWHIPMPFGIDSLPIRAYALCIVAGILVACVVMERRMRARGAQPYAVLDVAVWAVPFGIVGARIYHVVTSPQQYFGDGGNPVDALRIWEGGLGIWGSVAGGALGAWLAARQIGLSFGFIADTLAPGLALAQAVGRWGNWFNNELYGTQTDLPWGLKIHRMSGGSAELDQAGEPIQLVGAFHPTFLYESIWDVGVAVLVVLADRRFKFGKGRAFALYVMAYTAGRVWIEALRTDEATHIAGLRLNIWTSVVVFIAALIYFLRMRGPQEFVVPLGADGRPVDAEGRAAGQPADGYRVVTEQEFRRYQETGELPDAAGSDGAAPGETGPDEAGPGAAEPDAEREPAAKAADAAGPDDR